VSVRDITLDSVVAAVQAGHDDVFKLAEHFEVMHVSHTLRSTLREAVDSRALTQHPEQPAEGAVRYALPWKASS
jgi:hypothetical protein